MSYKEARKILEGLGYAREKAKEHNGKMVKPGKPPITLPLHHGQQYSKGLTRKILKQAGLL
jgi:predicted RNA binding protein YcfA (HicA-like mRNA interferase family)